MVVKPVKSNTSNLSILSEDDDIEKLGPEKRIRIDSKLLIKLWNKHCSPFQVMRAFAPISPRFMSEWTCKRFEKAKDATELQTVFQYTLSIFLVKGSGEFGLTRLLAPGALAKLPLIKRLPDKIKVPSLWLYGDIDWMNKHAGYKMCKEINKSGDKSNKAKFRLIQEAGHHVYLDNPRKFERLVMNFMLD
ncbi:unnamed protein product [Ambrosiozyma monospora]|uniref:Unnamed protein product n=1 Tax=Ambrosiozyma monospora TaxID=43982 RepID=A0ACB5TZ01_AMBMO|nr:unnamed protein product [Ambrosiozyma monospora]